MSAPLSPAARAYLIARYRAELFRQLVGAVPPLPLKTQLHASVSVAALALRGRI